MASRPFATTNASFATTSSASVASSAKSHVLAGVQDAYWSDDDAVRLLDPALSHKSLLNDLLYRRTTIAHSVWRKWTCPTSISSPVRAGIKYDFLTFVLSLSLTIRVRKICRFCWHHIKSNLNGRCPACRREYTDEGVQFKPISQEEYVVFLHEACEPLRVFKLTIAFPSQKRLTQQKKQRERERKELEHLKRSHLVNVRVVQRNLVYVTGMGTQFAKEEVHPFLGPPSESVC